MSFWETNVLFAQNLRLVGRCFSPLDIAGGGIVADARALLSEAESSARPMDCGIWTLVGGRSPEGFASCVFVNSVCEDFELCRVRVRHTELSWVSIVGFATKPGVNRTRDHWSAVEVAQAGEV
jgi:hypothetical protein